MDLICGSGWALPICSSGRCSSGFPSWSLKQPASSNDRQHYKQHYRHQVSAAHAQSGVHSAINSQPPGNLHSAPSRSSSSRCWKSALKPWEAGAVPATVESKDDNTAPVHYQVGSLIVSDEPLYDVGLSDGNDYQGQDWEEMTALLSFDGEEHKYVTRQMPGPHWRVEDMFASFDGDDFEAVMTAARGGEPACDTAEQETESALSSADASTSAAAAAEQAACCAAKKSTSLQETSSSLDSSDDVEDLYLAVTRRIAAGLAAEAQEKKKNKPKKRRAPLGSQPSDAWMFQEPTLGAVKPQYMPQKQYAAAQRVLLPPLVQEGAATIGHVAGGAAVVAAASIRQQEQRRDSDAVMLMVPRPQYDDRPGSPVAHTAQQQAPKHHAASGSSGSAAAPATPASGGVLGSVVAAAATAAGQQLQPGNLHRHSSRLLAVVSPVAPLHVATAAMESAYAAPKQSLGVVLADAQQAEAEVWLPVLSCSDDEDCQQTYADDAGVASSDIGNTHAASAALGAVQGWIVDTDNGVCNRSSRGLSAPALRRALLKLHVGLGLASGRPNGSNQH